MIKYLAHTYSIIKYFCIGLLCFIFCNPQGQAQQAYQSSHHMLNPYLFNPAYAGLNYSLAVNGNIRSQYAGLEGNPVSQSINAHMPIYAVGGATGLSMINEQLGAFRLTEVSGSFNKIFDSSSGIFSVGASLGVRQTSIDGTLLRTPDGNYQGGQINHNDPTLINQTRAGIAPIWNIGVFYVNRILETGLNVSHLPETTITIENADLAQRSHVNAFFKMKYFVSSQLRIEPSILLKSDFLIYQTDINLLLRYNGNVFGSIGLRGYSSASVDALIFTAGSRFGSKITAAYSYDAGLSNLKRVNEGSHELSIFFDLNRLLGEQKDEKIIYNPRNL